MPLVVEQSTFFYQPSAAYSKNFALTIWLVANWMCSQVINILWLVMLLKLHDIAFEQFFLCYSNSVMRCTSHSILNQNYESHFPLEPSISACAINLDNSIFF